LESVENDADVGACDFTVALQNIGWASAGFRTTFELSELPSDVGAIEVTLNDEPALGWSYDSALNAVLFDEASIPEAFAEVSIRYPIEGGCSE
jgi:hypothetical protein